MRENSKFIHDKFKEMFPLLYNEVGYWAEDKNDKQAIKLFSKMASGKSSLLFRFKYISDIKWSLERA
jgi:hypothetical protein